MIVRHRSPFAVARVGTFARPFSTPVTSPISWPFPAAFERAELAAALARRRTPVVDTAWVDGELRLSVDLPGVPADAVSVEVSDRTLHVSVSTDELRWERSVRLGSSLDPAAVSARHVDGRLTITVGTVTRPEPRRIAIDTAPAAPAIEATGSDTADDQPADATTEQPTEQPTDG